MRRFTGSSSFRLAVGVAAIALLSTAAVVVREHRASGQSAPTAPWSTYAITTDMTADMSVTMTCPGTDGKPYAFLFAGGTATSGNINMPGPSGPCTFAATAFDAPLNAWAYRVRHAVPGPRSEFLDSTKPTLTFDIKAVDAPISVTRVAKADDASTGDLTTASGIPIRGETTTATVTFETRSCSWAAAAVHGATLRLCDALATSVSVNGVVASGPADVWTVREVGSAIVDSIPSFGTGTLIGRHFNNGTVRSLRPIELERPAYVETTVNVSNDVAPYPTSALFYERFCGGPTTGSASIGVTTRFPVVRTFLENGRKCAFMLVTNTDVGAETGRVAASLTIDGQPRIDASVFMRHDFDPAEPGTTRRVNYSVRYDIAEPSDLVLETFNAGNALGWDTWAPGSTLRVGNFGPRNGITVSSAGDLRSARRILALPASTGDLDVELRIASFGATALATAQFFDSSWRLLAERPLTVTPTRLDREATAASNIVAKPAGAAWLIIGTTAWQSDYVVDALRITDRGTTSPTTTTTTTSAPVVTTTTVVTTTLVPATTTTRPAPTTTTTVAPTTTTTTTTTTTRPAPTTTTVASTTTTRPASTTTVAPPSSTFVAFLRGGATIGTTQIPWTPWYGTATVTNGTVSSPQSSFGAKVVFDAPYAVGGRTFTMSIPVAVQPGANPPVLVVQSFDAAWRKLSERIVACTSPSGADLISGCSLPGGLAQPTGTAHLLVGVSTGRTITFRDGGGGGFS